MTLEVRDAEELILVLVGYHKLLTERDLELIQDNSILAKLEEQQQQDEDQQGIHRIYYLIIHHIHTGWSKNNDAGEDVYNCLQHNCSLHAYSLHGLVYCYLTEKGYYLNVLLRPDLA